MATIFAQATAPGRAGVAVIRISGDDAFAVASGVMRNVPQSRGLRAIRNADGVIDRALVLSFRGGCLVLLVYCVDQNDQRSSIRSTKMWQMAKTWTLGRQCCPQSTDSTPTIFSLI